MKLGPVDKIYKKKKKKKTRPHQKNLTMTSCQQIVTPLSFFQFMGNLEESEIRILDV